MVDAPKAHAFGDCFATEFLQEGSMIANRRFVLASIAITLLGVPALAQPVLKLSGQVRTRMEYDDKSFRSSYAPLFTDMRTRFGVSADVDSSVHAFIQLQDSRRFGALANDRPATSTNTDNKNVDLHQAWLAVDNFPIENLRLQAGRFELSFGNERVIGSGDWHNVSRAFEGINLSFKESNCLTHLFAVQLIESTGGKLNEEYLLYGSNVSFLGPRLDLLALYEFDNDPRYPASERMRRLSLGAYFNRQLGEFDLAANGVYQMGSLHWPPSQPKQNISAYLVTAEVGYLLDTKTKTRMAIGIDYASGDDDEFLGDLNAYDNLFYTGHKFRGFMDYYLTGESTGYLGLFDQMVRVKMEPTKGWVFRGDLHRFLTAKSYWSGTERKKELGWEIDLVATTTRIKGFKFEMGAATFLPAKDFYGQNANPGYWGYMSAAVDF